MDWTICRIPVAVGLLLAWSGALAAAAAGDQMTEGLAAEARLDTRRALELFLLAEQERPDDPALLQKIARQYSDLVVDLPTSSEKRASGERALEYSRRAVALAPRNAENVISVAICLGKLALYSGTNDKVR